MLIDVLLAGALAGVVPLALRLPAAASLRPRRLDWVVALGAVAAASLLLEAGAAAAAAAATWFLVPAVMLWRQLVPVDPRRIARELAVVVPAGYLLVGAGWLVLSRYGARPLGFGDTIVQLTAVHFHYAGFVAPLLTLQVVRRLERDAARAASLARGALWGVVAATPLTAAGITFSAALGAAGAILFAVSLTVAAVLVLLFVVRRTQILPALLLGTSAMSVLASMVLAVLYASAQWLGTPGPSLPVMARTHGVLNALGFSVAGILGWVLQREGACEGRHS